MLRFATFVVIYFIASPMLAEIRLPKVIGSGMVLQRETEVRIWGWADPGEKFTLEADWLSETVELTSQTDGTWQIRLKTGKAGGPHRLVLQGKENRIVLDDILFGEVWIGSGQSNMEMPLIRVSGAYTGIQDAEKEVQQANFEQIRLFQVGNFSSKWPQDDVQSGIKMYGVPKSNCRWEKCSPESVRTFASTAYFFARHLHRELKVPIGIVDASWGGTNAEVWTPTNGLEKLGYVGELKQAETQPQKPDSKVPTRLYNGMIHPLRKMTIRGVIWYQGEGNTRRPKKYTELFSTMIQEWRRAFDQEFSFYYVQLAPFGYGANVNSAFLRESQLETLPRVKKSGMVVTLDIGDVRDIHPKNKQEVGRRLALWALAKDYRQPVKFSGPLFDSATVEPGKVRVRFKHAKGLKTADGKPVTEFEIAGADKQFRPAAARIVDDQLIVSSKEVAAPLYVRYAFKNVVQPNLVNASGLPASSFRSDR